MQSRAERMWNWIAIGGIGMLAFGLRVWAIDWALPYVPHPDEPAIVNPVLAMVRRGDWNPHFFNYPSLYVYALRGVFTLHWWLGRATGQYTGLDQLPQTTDSYVTTPDFYIWGRMLTLVFGVASVWLVYVIGRRWFGTSIGLIAALILAVLPFHVRNSQYITTDVPAGCTVLLAIWASLRLLDNRSWRAYALAGVCCGLATGTKYNVALVALALVAAHICGWGQHWWRKLPRVLWAAACTVLTFAIITPYALIEFGEFRMALARQAQSYSGGHGDSVGRWPVAEYLAFFWSDGFRYGPIVAALIGAGVIIWRRNRVGLVLLSFVGPYVLFLMAQRTHFYRNVLPAYGPIVLLAGVGIVAVAQISTRRMASRQQWATAGLVLIVAFWPLTKTVELMRFEAQPESRVQAGVYVRDELPRGLPVAVELNPVQWAGSPSVLPIQNVVAHSLAWYREQGMRYVLLNEYQHSADDRAAVAALIDQAQIVRSFRGNSEGSPGPHIDILDLGFDLNTIDLTEQSAQFAGLHLLGFQRGVGTGPRPTIGLLDNAAAIGGGQTLLLNLFWRVDQPVAEDYALFVHLLDAAGTIVMQRDAVIRQNDYPTSRWQAGEIVLDTPDLPLPAGLAAGTYQLKIGLYSLATQQRVPISGTAAVTPDGGLLLLDVVVGP